jgi:hypothetical protein
MAKENKVLVGVFGIIAVLCLLASYGAYSNTEKIQPAIVPTAEEIAALVVIPATQVYNDTAIVEKLYEEDNWESEAIELAKDDISNKDVYRFLEIEKENFDKFNYRDSEVLEYDVEDKDALVWLKLRAYFYDESVEDDIKETVYVLVTIEDGEVEDVEFDLEDDF